MAVGGSAIAHIGGYLTGLVLAGVLVKAALFVGIAQFVLRAFDKDASEDLARFGGRLGAYLGEIVGYINFARDTAPFPFSAFPKA